MFYLKSQCVNVFEFGFDFYYSVLCVTLLNFVYSLSRRKHAEKQQAQKKCASNSAHGHYNKLGENENGIYEKFRAYRNWI